MTGRRLGGRGREPGAWSTGWCRPPSSTPPSRPWSPICWPSRPPLALTVDALRALGRAVSAPEVAWSDPDLLRWSSASSAAANVRPCGSASEPVGGASGRRSASPGLPGVTTVVRQRSACAGALRCALARARQERSGGAARIPPQRLSGCGGPTMTGRGRRPGRRLPGRGLGPGGHGPARQAGPGRPAPLGRRRGRDRGARLPRPAGRPPRELATVRGRLRAVRPAGPHRPAAPGAGGWRPHRDGPRRWPVPAIDDLAALARWLGVTPDHLAWFADRRSMERTATDERLRHHRRRWARKADGSPRLLEAPKRELKDLQRQVLHHILDRVPAHDAAHGFRPGRSSQPPGCTWDGRWCCGSTWSRSSPRSAPGGCTACSAWPATRSRSPTRWPLLTTVTPGPSCARRPAGGVGGRSSAAAGCSTTSRRTPGPGGAHLAGAGQPGRLRPRPPAGVAGRPLHPLRHACRAVRRSTAGRPSTSTAGRRSPPARASASTPASRRAAAAQRQAVLGLVVNAWPSAPPRPTGSACCWRGPPRPGGRRPGGPRRLPGYLLGRISWVAAANPDRGARLRSAFDAVDWS